MRDTLKFVLNTTPLSQKIDVYIGVMAPSGDIRSVATNVTFENVPLDGERWPNPMFRLIPDEAQELMDQLWKVGIRPTEGAGSAGQMAATQKHLDDMRKMAFHLMKVK